MNNISPCVRFAPSPTGFLHLGNMRTALLNWLYAQKIGARFMLRLDDTDRKRSEERFVAALCQDLEWLGMTYDSSVRQSERQELYDRKIQELKEKGRLYPCYETPEELEVKRKLQLSRGKPPLYDREGLSLSEDEKRQKEAEGRTPHWRFFLEHRQVAWEDLVRGLLSYDVSAVSDPIVVREDGTVSFLLAGAVDDQDLGITHILRGEDHITNTAIQIQVLEALDAEKMLPAFGHFSWITDAQGQGFSKRLGSISIQDFRREGMFPEVISSFLSSLGTAHAPQVISTIQDLIESFDLSHFGRSTPKVAIEDMWRLHTHFLHDLPYDKALPLLAEKSLSPLTQDIWNVVRESLNRLEDIAYWEKVFREDVIFSHPSEDPSVDATFWESALELLPPEPFSEESWKYWTDAVKAQNGLAGKKLYHPLREVLTGLGSGPEMKKILPFLSREVVVKRLKSQFA